MQKVLIIFFNAPELDAYNWDLVLEHHNHAKSRNVQAPTFLPPTRRGMLQTEASGQNQPAYPELC
jgi:hypothetical protein